MARPPVTVLDPRSPTYVATSDSASVTTKQRAGLRVGERWLLVGTAVVLVLALARVNQVRASRSEGLFAVTTTTPVVVDASGRALVEGLVVSSRGSKDRVIQGVSVDHGWQVVPGGFGSVLAAGGSRALTLRREVDCTGPVRPPGELTVHLLGRTAHVRLSRVAVSDADVCGRLPAKAALRVNAASIYREAGRSLVVLRLGNVSLQAVSVQAVTFPGFVLTPDQPLPATLPGRAPGVLDPAALADLPLTLRAGVADCAVALQVITDAESNSSPDVLEVSVDGSGGPALTRLVVRGLEDFMAQQLRSECP